VPFASEDLNKAGGLSVSQGGHAKGVIVQLKARTKMVEFHTLDVDRGKVRTRKYKVSQLVRQGAKGMAKKVAKIKSRKPLVELSVQQVRSIASLVYSGLMTDESARTVHSPDEAITLRANDQIVSEIGAFVLMCSAASPGGCSCSSSCWACSSCSCSWG
jgi:hypothetical protein